MAYRLWWLFIVLGIYISCRSNKEAKRIPAHAARVVAFFDKPKLEEYDSVSFVLEQGSDRYNWTLYSGNGGFDYSVAWNASPENKDTNNETALRLSIQDTAFFMSKFPMKISLPESSVDLLFMGNGFITVQSSWISLVTTGKMITYQNTLLPQNVFVKENPFEYFNYRNKIMDSLGVFRISTYPGTNFIWITLSSQKEHLFYRPDIVRGNTEIIQDLDRFIATGERMNLNWTYYNGPQMKIHAQHR